VTKAKWETKDRKRVKARRCHGLLPIRPGLEVWWSGDLSGASRRQRDVGRGRRNAEGQKKETGKVNSPKTKKT